MMKMEGSQGIAYGSYQRITACYDDTHTDQGYPGISIQYDPPDTGNGMARTGGFPDCCS